jgi:hypothetical protein
MSNPKTNYRILTYDKLKKIVGDVFEIGELPSVPTVTVPKEAEFIHLPKPIFKSDETDSEFRSRRTAELMEVVPHGSYLLDSGGIKIQTGRGGYIQFLVALELSCKFYQLTSEE